ncbi:MAG: protein-glutamate O-methyltransferase CheR [Cellvibrionaceae bacterium]
MVWSLKKTTALTESEFEQWNKLLEERTGILFSAQQQAFLQTQIGIRMRELGFTEYVEYYKKVTDGIWGKAEWSVLVDRLMIKETSFFRHPHSYECVQRLINERLFKRLHNQDINQINNETPKENSDIKSFDVWSVGCSTGEEPYSLAILLNDSFERANLKPLYGIFATDISMPALSKARAGIFYERRLETLSKEDRIRYFKDVGNGRFKIINKIQERLCFSQGSVLDTNTMPVEKMDLIFCQNLLIYFRQWRRREIAQNLIDHLKPGGVLILGLGEMRDWNHAHLTRLPDDKVQAYVKVS